MKMQPRCDLCDASTALTDGRRLITEATLQEPTSNVSALVLEEYARLGTSSLKKQSQAKTQFSKTGQGRQKSKSKKARYLYWRSATANVRTLTERHDVSKLPYVLKQMNDHRIDIIGIQKCREKEFGSFLESVTVISEKIEHDDTI